MPSVLPACFTELAKLQPRLNGFFVFGGIIIDLLALGAFQFNKIILGHNFGIMN